MKLQPNSLAYLYWFSRWVIAALVGIVNVDVIVNAALVANAHIANIADILHVKLFFSRAVLGNSGTIPVLVRPRCICARAIRLGAVWWS